MFDVGASELLLIVITAVVVIGPKDLPLALRTAGRWIGKMRRVSGYFRSGLEAMIREAELEDMEKKWREQNEAIMKAHPAAGDQQIQLPSGLPYAPSPPAPDPYAPEPAIEPAVAPASAEAALTREAEPESEPQLPLGRS